MTDGEWRRVHMSVACRGAFKCGPSEKKREGTSVKKNKIDRARKSERVGVRDTETEESWRSAPKRKRGSGGVVKCDACTRWVDSLSCQYQNIPHTVKYISLFSARPGYTHNAHLQLKMALCLTVCFLPARHSICKEIKKALIWGVNFIVGCLNAQMTIMFLVQST